VKVVYGFMVTSSGLGVFSCYWNSNHEQRSPRRKVLSASLSHFPVIVYWREWHRRSLWTFTVHLETWNLLIYCLPVHLGQYRWVLNFWWWNLIKDSKLWATELIQIWSLMNKNLISSDCKVITVGLVCVFCDFNSITWVPISWVGLLSTFAGQDSCIIRCL